MYDVRSVVLRDPHSLRTEAVAFVHVVLEEVEVV